MESGAKRAIAKAAAALIAPAVVIIDGGTTSAELVRQLPLNLNATIVTHSPSVAVGSVDHPTVEVILIGGRLYKHSIVSAGAAAVEAMSHIRADIYFMGVTGVHPTAGLSTGDLEEAYIKRALAFARRKPWCWPPPPLNAASQYAIGDITLAHTIIVERATDDALIAPLQQAGVSVLKA